MGDDPATAGSASPSEELSGGEGAAGTGTAAGGATANYNFKLNAEGFIVDPLTDEEINLTQAVDEFSQAVFSEDQTGVRVYV